MTNGKWMGTLLLSVLALAGACSGTRKATAGTPAPAGITDSAQLMTDDSLLTALLASRPAFFADVVQRRKSFKLQIIYTEINRNVRNEPSFTRHYFNLSDSQYFYPASTVKMPVALLSLEVLNELKLPMVDKNASLITGAAYNKQTPVFNDPSAADGRPSVAQYVKKIFLVSDNDAFNRLYELLGQQKINARLHAMGYTDAQLLHRLEISMTPDENRHTNPVSMYDTSGRLRYQQPMLVNQAQYDLRQDSAGHAYYSKGALVPHAMDFSLKNRISLKDLTDILQATLFPLSVPEKQRFNLTDSDYLFLKKYMSEWPTESLYPPYSADTASYWPTYCKFLLFGSAKGPVPSNIRIFNKVGDAYGFLTDVAYIVDFDKKIEFMLSARIYCNADEVLNDDRYDYDTVGFPFMKELGQLIYDYEAKRPRKVSPDLSAFVMSYDK